MLIAEFFVEAMGYLDYVFVPFKQEMPEIELTLVTAKKNSRPVVKQIYNFFLSLTEADR